MLSRAAAFAFLLALGLAACSKTPEAHLEEGKKYVEQANFKAAAVELKTVLQSQPSNREARLLLGQTLYRLGAYADAEKELGKARELGASDDQVLPLLTMSRLRMGKTQDVLKLTIPATGLSPRSLASLHTARAAALLSTDQRPAAEAALVAAEQADPKLPELLILKARLALADKQLDKAIQYVDTALQGDPKLTEALYLKAALWQKADKPEEAAKVYQQIIAYDPGEFRAHLAIASLLMQQGKLEAAEAPLEAAEKIAEKSPEVRYTRGIFELQRGKFENAGSALLDVLRVAPDHLPTALAYATVTYGLGQYEQSLKYAEKVLAAEPDNLVAAKIVAGCQMKLGSLQNALKILNPMLAKHPDDARLWALAGEAYLLAKDYNKAMNYLDKAAELDPQSPAIKTRRAAGHLALGDREQAIADLESVASLSDKAGQADLTLVMLHLRDKEYDKALQAIKLLQKKLPNNPVIHNLRAAALMGKKDLTGARDALEQALAVQPNFFPAAVNLARLDIQENKPEAARKRFESILAQDKNNARAMLALADLAALQKQDGARIEWLDKALKADPTLLTAYQQLIGVHLLKKDYLKALAVAKQAVSANPESLAALDLLGATQSATGDHAAATETFTRLVQKAPQSPGAQLHLAIAQLAARQPGAARTALKAALQLKPDFIEAQDMLMKVELAEHKPEAALGVARQIQAQRPKSALGFEREGDIHLSQKRLSQAIKAYEQALAKEATSGGFIKLNRALVLAGNTKDAEQRLHTWLQQHPNDPATLGYAGRFYTHLKRYKDAIVHYERLQTLQPNDAMALNSLATLYQLEKDRRALATAEQALKLAPNHPYIQDTLGWILVEQGQLSRALELLAKAAAGAPNIAAIRYHYGAALLKSGKKAEAKKELTTAIDLGQDFAEKENAQNLLKQL
jgi:putative PEP-CTERM system TPR-repeat lipoprotein